MTRTLLRKIGQAEYAALRVPLELLDQRVAARYLADDSRVRVVLGRGIGALDSAAARLLGGGDTSRGTPASENPRRPEAESDERPVDEPESVPVEDVERVADELLTEQAETPLVGELAEADDAAAQAMAKLRAKHIVEEAKETTETTRS